MRQDNGLHPKECKKRRTQLFARDLCIPKGRSGCTSTTTETYCHGWYVTKGAGGTSRYATFLARPAKRCCATAKSCACEIWKRTCAARNARRKTTRWRCNDVCRHLSAASDE